MHTTHTMTTKREKITTKLVQFPFKKFPIIISFSLFWRTFFSRFLTWTLLRLAYSMLSSLWQFCTSTCNTHLKKSTYFQHRIIHILKSCYMCAQVYTVLLDGIFGRPLTFLTKHRQKNLFQILTSKVLFKWGFPQFRCGMT